LLLVAGTTGRVPDALASAAKLYAPAGAAGAGAAAWSSPAWAVCPMLRSPALTAVLDLRAIFAATLAEDIAWSPAPGSR
jgi:hypothetical protein